MPAITEHEAFADKVPDDALVWRYMDLAKLVYLLETQHLYLCPIRDLPAGCFELPMPPAVYEQHRKAWEKLVNEFNEQLKGKQPPTSVEFIEQMHLDAGQSACVSSWCQHSEESMLMWATYAAGSSGIALRCRFADMANALPDGLHWGRVRYVGASEGGSFETSLHQAMRKLSAFEGERECRVVGWPKTPEGGYPFADAWKYRQGFSVPLDLSLARVCVVTSPLMPKWLQDAVAGMIKKSGLPLSFEPSPSTVNVLSLGSKALPNPRANGPSWQVQSTDYHPR